MQAIPLDSSGDEEDEEISQIIFSKVQKAKGKDRSSQTEKVKEIEYFREENQRQSSEMVIK